MQKFADKERKKKREQTHKTFPEARYHQNMKKKEDKCIGIVMINKPTKNSGQENTAHTPCEKKMKRKKSRRAK